MIGYRVITGALGRLAFVSVAITLVLVGCGSSQQASATDQSVQVTTQTASAVLRHMPRGAVLLTWTPDNQTLNVSVRLYGLAPNSTHPAQIRTGGCSKQGSVLYTLHSLVANAYGVAAMTTQIKDVRHGIPASGWLVIVHNGPGLSPAIQYLPIACGDITNPAHSTTSKQQIPVPLMAVPGSGFSENAAGSAHLQLSKDTLTVRLTMSGLAPNSTHAAHIHTGSCQRQGPVIYPLDAVKADASGDATVTTTIHNVKTIPASGWYVNVHQGTDLSTQTGFDPIACGNVQKSS
ncbi:MAG TPA: CHRD domain-containing protein [Ktedonobacteraceae bacterium]|nr:CHRD domain-containing protein [Ktedonobacteraceae bacterium]